MICQNCGYQLSDDTVFCVNCGTKVTNASQGAPVQSAPSQSAPAQNAGAAAPGTGYTNPQGAVYGAAMPQYVAQMPYTQQVIVNTPDPADRVPSKGEYLTWGLLMPLLNLIPLIGTIIFVVMVFVNAFDKSYKAKANYFKAILTIWLIMFILALIAGIVLGILAATGTFMLSELGYYLGF